MADVVYTMPTGGKTWMTLSDMAAAITTSQADILKLKADVLKLQMAPGTVVAPPLDPAWLVNQTVSSGAVLTLPGGTETGNMSTAVPLTIGGVGMRSTILDGQGGVGAGFRLAMGKGIIHVGAGILIHDIGFINGGGADGVSDGEAGVYAEAFNTLGTATLTRCAFDGCENGVYMPNISLANVDLVIDRCAFGVKTHNGIADGRSHDMYVAGHSVTIKGSVYAGSSFGNTIKCRGPKLDVSSSYIGRRNGRWIDAPGGTVITSTGNTYVTQVGALSGNAMGFYDESDTSANPALFGSFTSIDDTFVFSRAAETIWINSTSTLVLFTRPIVKWVGAAGSAPPVVTIQGPGQITGTNPFIPAAFTEANRLDVAPAVPNDPS